MSETLSRRLGSLPAGPVVTAIILAVKALRRRRVRRQVLAELHRLDERMLTDIGLDRAHLGEVAESMARRYADEGRPVCASDLLKTDERRARPPL